MSVFKKSGKVIQLSTGILPILSISPSVDGLFPSYDHGTVIVNTDSAAGTLTLTLPSLSNTFTPQQGQIIRVVRQGATNTLNIRSGTDVVIKKYVGGSLAELGAVDDIVFSSANDSLTLMYVDDNIFYLVDISGSITIP